jgi:hypothetical protein
MNTEPKDYILTIGLDKYPLTEKERDYYMQMVEKGAKFVDLGNGRVFGVNMQSLVHKNVSKGMWGCDFGGWHGRDAECFCNGEWEKLPSGQMAFVQKTELKKI